jgi:hypothetical protein
MAKQAASYPLRLPQHVRDFYQRRADHLDRSLHWVILRTLEQAATDGGNGSEKEKAPNA